MTPLSSTYDLSDASENMKYFQAVVTMQFERCVIWSWKALNVKNFKKELTEILKSKDISQYALSKTFSVLWADVISAWSGFGSCWPAMTPKNQFTWVRCMATLWPKRIGGTPTSLVGEGKYRDSFYFSSSPKILSCGATVSHFISLNKLILILMNLRYLPTSWCNI